MIVPLTILSFSLKGEVTRKLGMVERHHLEDRTTPFEQKLVLFLGVGALLFVPVFKTVTQSTPLHGNSPGTWRTLDRYGNNAPI